MNKHINTIKTKNNLNKGFSVIETIVYISVLAIITTVVTTSIITLFKNYNIINSTQTIEKNAITILDKINRNTKDARDVVSAQSVFQNAQGALAIQIASSTNPNSSSTVKFYLENKKLKYSIDSVFIGNLSTNSVQVESFKVYYIQASSTEAVKIELQIQAQPRYSSIISKNFYSTIQLRE